MDSAREKCGVMAVSGGSPPAAPTIRAGLTALQHRGEEAAGLAMADRGAIHILHGPGLVSQALDAAAVAAMTGSCGIGHVRYSTAGAAGGQNPQPIPGLTRAGTPFALAHNGNLLAVAGRTTAATRVPELLRQESGDCDTRLLVEAVADHPGASMADALAAVLPTVVGAFSIVVLTPDAIYAARDPQGFRPLCLGRLEGGRLEGGWVVASETVALEAAGARFVREVAPGEIVTVTGTGLRASRFATPDPALCVFEHIYFSRPDSQLGGRRVQQVRRAMGMALARDAPAAGDVVMPIPETARPAASGFAAVSGIHYEEGLVRNAYVGRTFISPDNRERQRGILLKLNAIPEVVEGKQVVVVDDSIVRANSARAIVTMLRSAGASGVHLRISSPPIRWPCYFGVDLSNRGEIAAADRSVRDMRDLVGADTLGYLSLDALTRAVGTAGICTGCFTGDYPVDVHAARSRENPLASRTPPEPVPAGRP
jgi:amidophosphoribosyltransferase